MVYLSSVSNQNSKIQRCLSFGNEPKEAEQEKIQTEEALLLNNQNPIKTAIEVHADKFVKSFTTYPAKGFEGSKNSDFYEYLTMGDYTAYGVGSIFMAGTYLFANKFFDTNSQKFASKVAKHAAWGVGLYALGKKFSPYLIETPLNLKYGIDLNLAYRKKINEFPEERNVDLKHFNDNNDGNEQKGNLVSFEYHKVFDSTDFPRLDLTNKYNAFDYYKAGKAMGFSDEDLEYPEQKVKPHLMEKVVQAKGVSTLAAYCWAALGVCLAAQKPFEEINIEPVKRMKDLYHGVKRKPLISQIGNAFVKSFKELVGSDKASIIIKKCKNQMISPKDMPLAKHIAGRMLAGLTLGTTLLGNFLTLTDFNNNGGSNSKNINSLIDDSKEKVVC